MKKASLGHSEVTTFIIVMMGTKTFLGHPRLVTEVGLTAGWLITLLSGLISIGFWLFISDILVRFPGKSLAEIIESIFGSVLGIMINLIIVGYIYFNTSNMVRLFSESVAITALTEARINALALLFILGIWFAAYYGLEAISRSAYISFPFITVGVGIVLITLYPYYDFKQLLPIMGSGVLPVIKESFVTTAAFGEITYLAYLTKYFSFETEKLKKIGVFSILIVTILSVAVVVVYLMVLPYPTSSETLVPFYQLSRSIFLGHYFQRVEAAFIIFWTLMAFLRLSLGIIISALILQDIFKVPYYRPLLPALCLLAFSLALTPTDFMQSIKFEGVFKAYAWLVTFILPLLVWVVAIVLRKGGNRTNDAES